ncbi:MAG: CPBP family intramembrane metalloprotease [Bacteroidales bacterium]|nr:CPBP family intramembrane metalloprotease [Bacteroidales bacterium]
MKNPFFEQTSAPLKIIFFMFIIVGSFFVLLFLGTVISILVFQIDFSNFASSFDFSNPGNISFIKFMQAVQHLGIFVLPPIIAAYLFSKKPKTYLSADKSSSAFLFLVTFLIVLFIIPISGYLGSLNSQMSLPESLAGLEEKMRLAEKSAEIATSAFLDVSTIGGLLVNLFVIAVLPAVGEEFFFRGILQKLFKDWTKNIHVSVFITAILFSAVHMQFFTFLPRFILGLLFGYLLVWSKNIWIPVFAHFVNNAISVLVYFFTESAEKVEQTEDAIAQPTALFMTFALFGIFLFLFYRRTHKKVPNPEL